jgi:cell division protein FtsB
MFDAATTRFFRRLLLLAIFAAFLGALGYHALDPATGARREMLERQHTRLLGRVADLAHHNARLAEELSALENGLDAWRDVARHELGMILPGEVVYRFPVKPPPPAP